MITYKKYDSKGRRISMFGRQVGDNLEVFMLICSKQDVFSKKVAKAIYKQYLEGRLTDGAENITLVPIQSGDTANYTFYRYTKNHFYKKEIATYCDPGKGEIPLEVKIKSSNSKKMFSPQGKYVEITKLVRR